MGELGECKQEIVINKNNSKINYQTIKVYFHRERMGFVNKFNVKLSYFFWVGINRITVKFTS